MNLIHSCYLTVACPNLSNPDSGIVSLSTTGLVTTATYTCASGYSLTSDGTLQCKVDGTWDVTPPMCGNKIEEICSSHCMV